MQVSPAIYKHHVLNIFCCTGIFFQSHSFFLSFLIGSRRSYVTKPKLSSEFPDPIQHAILSLLQHGQPFCSFPSKNMVFNAGCLFETFLKWYSALLLGTTAWKCKCKLDASFSLLCSIPQCSASCGEGVQTRTVTCRTQRGSQAQDFACLMEPKPPATQPCLKENCIQEVGWHVGDWGLVSIMLSCIGNN